ncbi:MAG: FecR family protein [Daejeonella sp.]|uniref:FecR family protein n=1 Tax=Daejeonella sp. TaxID=2805397 RepID=UPI002734B481|nr:FecR family protein [Daejeonella sp.]MDP3466684.1 FecR family protein [Daejeonella sp.]
MDRIQREQFLKILEKYRAGNASAEEMDFLDTYYRVFGLRPDYTSGMEEGKRIILKEDLKNSILENISTYQNNKIQKGKRKIYKWSVSIAAATLIICGAWLFYHPQKIESFQAINSVKRDSSIISKEKVEPKVEIIPGGNKAVLTLANGKKINLTDVNIGMLAEQSNVQITKIADGQLVYSVLTDQQAINNQKDQYNTIETPRGGRYQMRLPDGTNVWLNSASRLTYPSSFSNLKNRRVELSGEAYFEVAKDKTRPFLVKTILQEVEVLGTHFNISSYEDESSVKTTLLEGSVKIVGINGSDKILKAGQQSVLTSDNIIVEDIRTGQQAVAWKNDQFVFESIDIQHVMRMISRWYNVEVEYVGAIPENKFGGSISKFENISEVLKSLESTGRVKFEIEGRRILVSK